MAFQDGLWDEKYSEQQKTFMCAMGMTNSAFYYCCIFCWTLTVMIEVRTNMNFAWDVRRMPRCFNPLEQIEMKKCDDGKPSESVVALTFCSRFIIFLIIV